MAVLLLVQAKDLTIGVVQRGKQGCRSVALVIVGYGLSATFLQRQSGLGLIQSLYRIGIVSSGPGGRVLYRIVSMAWRSGGRFQHRSRIRFSPTCMRA